MPALAWIDIFNIFMTALIGSTVTTLSYSFILTVEGCISVKNMYKKAFLALAISFLFNALILLMLIGIGYL